MALVSRLVPTRIAIPNEPGEWVEIRPLTAGAAADIKDSGVGYGAATVAILVSIIAAWSYPVPVSEDAIRDLDSDTFTWLQEQMSIASGVRTDAEKNGSSATSGSTSSRPQPTQSSESLAS